MNQPLEQSEPVIEDEGYVNKAINIGSGVVSATKTAIDVTTTVIDKSTALAATGMDVGKKAYAKTSETVNVLTADMGSKLTTIPSKAEILSFDAIGRTLGLTAPDGRTLSQQTPEEIQKQLNNLNQTFKSPEFQKELNKSIVEATAALKMFQDAATEPIKKGVDQTVEIAADAANKMTEQSAQLVLNAIGVVPIVGEVLSGVRAVDNLIKMGVLGIDGMTKSVELVAGTAIVISNKMLDSKINALQQQLLQQTPGQKQQELQQKLDQLNVEKTRNIASVPSPVVTSPTVTSQAKGSPAIPLKTSRGGGSRGSSASAAKKTLRALKKENRDTLKRANKSINEIVGAKQHASRKISRNSRKMTKKRPKR